MAGQLRPYVGRSSKDSQNLLVDISPIVNTGLFIVTYSFAAVTSGSVPAAEAG